jgi:hypothetical protein
MPNENPDFILPTEHPGIFILAGALRAFADRFTGEVAGDTAQSFTCSEVEAVAGVLRAVGCTGDADAWIEEHALGDEEGDQHWDGERQPPVPEWTDHAAEGGNA